MDLNAERNYLMIIYFYKDHNVITEVPLNLDMILWMHYAYVSTLNRATFWNMLLWQNANLNRREETIKVQGQYQLSFEVKLKRNIIYFTLMPWIDNPVCLFLSMFVSSIKIEFFYNSHFDSFVIQVHPNYTLIQMEHFYLQIYRNGTTVYF